MIGGECRHYYSCYLHDIVGDLVAVYISVVHPNTLLMAKHI